MSRYLVLALMLIAVHLPSVVLADENRCSARSAIQSTMGIACEADADVCRVWRQFRDAHPFPYQTLAVSLDPSGDAVVIVSEPPPIATPQEIVDVVAALFGEGTSVKRLRFPVGHDGWLEDIVVRVPASTGASVPVPTAAGDFLTLPGGLADRLQYLSGVLYATSDGFYVDRASDPGPAPHRSLDKPTMTEAHLQQLMRDQSVTWAELGVSSSAAMSWQDALRLKKVTALVDNSAAVVVLVVPPMTELRDMSSEFRRFAVSTDYLIGALGPSRGGVVLFGRNRQLGLDVMPPLRFETLASLSTTLGQPLGQSYERQRVFAGKLSSGPFESWDWAPIFLSPQLQDTEFGLLLDLADQQLKSWSERGNVRYARFDIPDPSAFPFKEETASGWFMKNTGSLSLIFNWNTNGFGRIASGAFGRIISATSLSALPVSYILPSPDHSELQRLLSAHSRSDWVSSVEQGSRVGSQYFADLGDPILARVARNVFLYQVLNATQPFRKPKTPTATETARSLSVSKILTSEVSYWLKQAVSPGPERNQTVARLFGDLGMPLNKLAELIAAPQSNTREIVSAQTTWRNKIAEHQALTMELLTKQAEVGRLAERAEAAFISECQAAGGQLTREGIRLRCSMKVSQFADRHELAALEKLRFGQAKNEMEAIESRMERCQEALKATASTLQRLSQERKSAERIADELRARSSMDADLAAVLNRVLVATRSTASTSSIQTPSVVLSCNAVNQAMVGGHNIDPIPAQFDSSRRPGAFASGKLATLSKRQAGIAPGGKLAAPTQPLAEALRLSAGRPRGSFLERMQARSELQAEASHAVFERARHCNCDVYVERGEAGTATIVRLGPPPVANTVFGSSPLVQRLSHAKPSTRVLFAGFGKERAQALTLSAAQRAKTSGRMSPPHQDSVRSARALFRNVVDRAQTVFKLKSSGAKPVTVVADATVSGERFSAFLDARPSSKTAKVTQTAGSNALVEVVFPGASTDLSKLEVYVYDADSVALRAPKLRAVATDTINEATRSNPRVEQILERLGERLIRDSSVQQVEFFFKDVGSIVRLHKVSGQVYAQVALVR